MRIGILGGTFDPPHIGHMIMAEKAYEQFNLDKVWIMPTGNPGKYKDRDDITHKNTRSDMVKLSIKNNPHFEFSDLEMNRSGVIYTYDTLKELSKTNPKDHFYFIIGGDSLNNIMCWYKPEEIFKLCTLIVAKRNDVNSEKIAKIIEELKENYGADIRILNTPNIDISSSDIRQKAATGQSFRYYVTDSTYDYIKDKGIYKQWN